MALSPGPELHSKPNSPCIKHKTLSLVTALSAQKSERTHSSYKCTNEGSTAWKRCEQWKMFRSWFSMTFWWECPFQPAPITSFKSIPESHLMMPSNSTFPCSLTLQRAPRGNFTDVLTAARCYIFIWVNFYKRCGVCEGYVWLAIIITAVLRSHEALKESGW